MAKEKVGHGQEERLRDRGAAAAGEVAVAVRAAGRSRSTVSLRRQEGNLESPRELIGPSWGGSWQVLATNRRILGIEEMMAGTEEATELAAVTETR